MRTVAFGDSVTYGEHVSPDQTWAVLCGFIPKGVCADTTRLALERFPRDVQQSGASRVLIQFGFNDCNRWDTDRNLPRVSPHAFEANLREMVARAQAFQIEPVLVGTFRTAKNSGYETDRRQYNDIIRSVAAFDNIELVDPEPHIERGHLWDDLHLNREGHRVFADLVAR